MNVIGTYLAMGGYAVYVWPAYALAFAVLGGLTVYSWRRYRASVRSLDQLPPRREPRR